MNVRKPVVFLVLIAFLAELGFASASEDTSRIYYRGTKDYVDVIKAAKITEKDAHRILRATVKGRNSVYFDADPLLFLNGEYLFGVPKKDRLPLTGYYINASSGRIVFRESKLMISVDEKQVPPNAFEREELLREP